MCSLLRSAGRNGAPGVRDFEASAIPIEKELTPATPATRRSNSSEEDHPFNTGFPSGRNTRYHLPSTCRSQPIRNIKLGENVVASGLHVELTAVTTRSCLSQESSMISH